MSCWLIRTRCGPARVRRGQPRSISGARRVLPGRLRSAAPGLVHRTPGISCEGPRLTGLRQLLHPLCSAASLAFPHASRPSFGNPLGSCDARMRRQFRYATLPGRSGWTLRRGTNPTPRRYTPSSVTIEASPATRVPVPMARRPCATRTAGTKDIPMRIRRLRYVDCSCAPHFSQSNPRNASENNMALRGTTASHLGHRMLLPPTCPQNTGDQLRGPRFPAGADLVCCIPLFDSTAVSQSPGFRCRRSVSREPNSVAPDPSPDSVALIP